MITWSALIVGRLVDFYLLSTVLLVIALLAMRWLRHPTQRMTWSWGVTATLVLIAGAMLLPGLRQKPRQWFAAAQSWLSSGPEIETPPLQESLPSEAPIIPPLAADADPFALPQPIAAAEATLQPSLLWPAVRVSLATAWCSAAVLTAGWLLIGALQVRRIKRRVAAVPAWAQDELTKFAGGKSAPLFASPHVQTAVALGALRPAILLPAAEVHDDNQPAIRASIRHEWAHIAHGDLWLHAIQRLLTIVLFAHPLYWIFRQQTRADQELLADAAASGNDPLGYAETLLTWARQVATRDPKYRRSAAESFGLTLWRDASSLQRRIEMLVEQKSSSYVQPGRFARTSVIALLLFLGASLSTLTVQSQEQSPETDTPITDLVTQSNGHIHVIQGKDQGGKRQVVINQMPGRLVITVHEAVLGPDLETTYAAKDAATLQKRHPEIFRLYERFSAAANQQAGQIVRDTNRLRTTAATNTKPPALDATAKESPIFLIDSTIGAIHHATFVDTGVRLEDIFETRLAGKCELQGNLIIALCTPAEAQQFKASLVDAKALTIVSRPKLVTHNGRSASIRVGSEVPLRPNFPETEMKVAFEGIALDVSPSITFENQDRNKPAQLGIEVKAEFSELDTFATAPVLSRREMKFNAMFEPGQILLVAERQPKGNVKDKPAETIFLQINMQEATPEILQAAEAEGSTRAAPIMRGGPTWPRFEGRSNANNANPVASPALQALREENAALKAENQQFRAMHADLIKQMEQERRDKLAIGGQPPTTAAETTVRVYRLQNIQADKAGELVSEQAAGIKQDLKVATDERTNSLIIAGDARAHVLAAVLLKHLDNQPSANSGLPPQASNAPSATAATTPPAPEIEKQLRELEVLEAEAVLATAKSRWERLQQMHQTGQVSQAELSAADIAAKTAVVNLELARRPNDPRFQAEAQLQLAEVKLQASKTDYERASKQSKAGTISAEEVATRELELRRAEIAVRRAKLQLDALQKNVPRTK